MELMPVDGATNGGFIGRWEESARDEANDSIRDEGIATVQPKGILVVGNLASLATPDARRSFELLRRNLVNPEIITFDELLERARFIAEADEPVP